MPQVSVFNNSATLASVEYPTGCFQTISPGVSAKFTAQIFEHFTLTDSVNTAIGHVGRGYDLNANIGNSGTGTMLVLANNSLNHEGYTLLTVSRGFPWLLTLVLVWTVINILRRMKEI